jgi:hypothetical protein
MDNSKDYRPAAYVIILLGFVAAAAAAVVPFFSAGYELNTGTLLAVITPFVLYGMLTESLRGPWLLAAGLVLLAVSLGEVIPERYLHYNAYADRSIYWVPVLTAVIVLPIAYVFGGGWRRASEERKG